MANIQKFGGFRFIKGCNDKGTTYAVSDVINYITGNNELKNAICFVSTGADTKHPNYIVFNGKAFGDAEALNQYLKNVQVSEITDSTEGTKIPQVIAVKKYVNDEITKVNNSITNLGTAAHSNVLEGSIANETSGLTTEKQVKNYVDGEIEKVNTAIGNLDNTVTASTNNLEIKIVQENGLLKTVTLTETTLDGDIATASDNNLNKLVNAGQVKEYVTPQINALSGRIDGLGTAAHSNVLTGSTISATSDNLTTEGQVKTYVDGEITKVNTAIGNLDADLTGTSAHLNVQIVQTDGKLASVNVTESNFGDAANATVLSGDTISGESANLTTEKQVKAYVDGKIATVNGKLGDAAEKTVLKETIVNSVTANTTGNLTTAGQVKEYVETTVNGLNSTGAGTSEKSGIKVNVVQTDGKITGVAVEDTLGTAAKRDALGTDAAISGNTGSDDLVSAKQVNELVATLDANVTSNTTTNGGIKVQVVETDGKIDEVVVTDALGTVARKNVFEGTISGTTGVDAAIPTVEQVKAYVTSSVASLNGAMHFIGAVDKLPENNSGYTAGDVLLVGYKEYVFDGAKWVELGDESIYVAKDTEIAGVKIQSGITKDALVDALELNANVTSNTTTNGGISVQVVETKGKITAVNVTDSLGTAAGKNVLTGYISGATQSNQGSSLVTADQVMAWTEDTDLKANEAKNDIALIKDDLDKKFIKSVNGQTPTSGSVTIDGNNIQIHPVDANYNPTPKVNIVNYQGNVENAIIGLETAIAETSKLSSKDDSITVEATDYSGASVNKIAVNKKTLVEADVQAGKTVQLEQDNGNGPLYGVMYYIADEIPAIDIPVVQGGGGPK